MQGHDYLRELLDNSLNANHRQRGRKAFTSLRPANVPDGSFVNVAAVHGGESFADAAASSSNAVLRQRVVRVEARRQWYWQQKTGGTSSTLRAGGGRMMGHSRLVA
jgi:hypothetical protein